MDRTAVKKTVITALFTALIAAGAFIRIPLPPVPVTLQTLFVLICGLLLPLSLSLSALGVYFFLGLVGLPVFTSGGGIAAFAGPTGGYITGMVPAVVILALFRKKDSLWMYIAGCVLATAAIYIPGLLWLRHSLSLSWEATLAAGLVPFIIGDSIKIAVACAAGKTLRPQADALLRNPGQ